MSKEIAGKYKYNEAPKDIYRRHRYCRCQTLYYPKNGSKKKQDVWSKKWKSSEESDKLELRKNEGLENGNSKIIRNNIFVLDKIKSGEYGIQINPEMQEVHIEGKHQEGKSYLFKNINPQELFDKHFGTGEMEKDRKGNFKNTEICTSKIDIGFDMRSNDKTNRFKIHHSKKRTHIVPTRIRENENW